MNTPIVYLAGGMSYLSPEDALHWRQQAASTLGVRGIETLSPMRGHPAQLRDSAIIHPFDDVAMAGGPDGVILRDLTDVKRSDALLVNLLGAKKISVGTAMELGWAYILNIPAVVVIEDAGNPHDEHPMVKAAMRYRVSSLDDAIDAVAVILGR